VELHGENPPKNVIAIVPARYSSVRLPGKLLLPIAGRPLILHTVDAAKASSSVDRVIVATDDERIFEIVSESGVDVVMTATDHPSGTDRIAEVAKDLPSDSIIVNVQGDEPTIDPRTIDAAVGAILEDLNADMATTSESIENVDEIFDGNVVKVAAGDKGYAVHFSRSPIPYPRNAVSRHGDLRRALAAEPELTSVFRKHTGLYVYRREYLIRLSMLPPTRLEQTEMLEQLRALEDGARIRVVAAIGRSIGIDTKEDYERVCSILEGNKESATLRSHP
jgi:3-deoxy-manno-octulosonate cytidylyltransferase (CMP-KDO synthetase)